MCWSVGELVGWSVVRKGTGPPVPLGLCGRVLTGSILNAMNPTDSRSSVVAQEVKREDKRVICVM